MYGVLEVFVGTLLICTATALPQAGSSKRFWKPKDGKDAFHRVPDSA